MQVRQHQGLEPLLAASQSMGQWAAHAGQAPASIQRALDWPSYDPACCRSAAWSIDAARPVGIVSAVAPAGNQIRNTAGVGGNIVTGSPISDLNPIYMAARAVFTTAGEGTKSRTVPATDFFLGYRSAPCAHAAVFRHPPCHCCPAVEHQGAFLYNMPAAGWGKAHQVLLAARSSLPPGSHLVRHLLQPGSTPFCSLLQSLRAWGLLCVAWQGIDQRPSV